MSNIGSTCLEVQPNYFNPAILDQATMTNELDPDVLDSKSTWVHQAWLAIACITVLIALAKSIAVVTIDSYTLWVNLILASLAGYVMSDLVSGVYHWAIDNYGETTHPIFGSQIEAFRWHHEKPWVISRWQVAKNLYQLSRFTTFAFLPINLIFNDPTLMAFVGSLSGFFLCSHQFHAWSHATKNNIPPIVVALQDLEVILSRSSHAAHHNSSFNSNYCIVNGICNKFLDEYKVFVTCEKVIFKCFGVKPRSWNEPSLKFNEENSTRSLPRMKVSL